MPTAATLRGWQAAVHRKNAPVRGCGPPQAPAADYGLPQAPAVPCCCIRGPHRRAAVPCGLLKAKVVNFTPRGGLEVGTIGFAQDSPTDLAASSPLSSSQIDATFTTDAAGDATWQQAAEGAGGVDPLGPPCPGERRRTLLGPEAAFVVELDRHRLHWPPGTSSPDLHGRAVMNWRSFMACCHASSTADCCGRQVGGGGDEAVAGTGEHVPRRLGRRPSTRRRLFAPNSDESGKQPKKRMLARSVAAEARAAGRVQSLAQHHKANQALADGWTVRDTAIAGSAQRGNINPSTRHLHRRNPKRCGAQRMGHLARTAEGAPGEASGRYNNIQQGSRRSRQSGSIGREAFS